MLTTSHHQYEMPVIATQVFNLAGEEGEDPFRIERERWAAEQAKAEAAEYERRMQRTLAECPGFIGADAPAGPGKVGRVVVEPAHIPAAMAWLKRRFIVAENIELSRDEGLVVDIAPRVRRVTQGQRPAKVRFGKPEQYSLKLDLE